GALPGWLATAGPFGALPPLVAAFAVFVAGVIAAVLVLYAVAALVIGLRRRNARA
ncbi:MAG: hypothetical protein GWO39_08805, partial [Gammaproteobacteria bacterium]|nr:hypothetical protein [Gammaproteobacteria bacterium]NIT63866.1 hypothetical protein [Gammaproteobacteria bacterium]NIV20870.1 hypothetical protein [Gammaproteobacteria bacterium]NIY32446.1 hypothetical protein [Gammaproteobacteria bacterium]